MSSCLSKQAILGANDLERKEINVPEWGGRVYVRTMSGSERDSFEERTLSQPYKDLRARLAVATVCDRDGVLLFGDDDVSALTKKSSKALDRVFAVATRLSGLSRDDIEDLKKNSSVTPS
jgi:hypothetical protein